MRGGASSENGKSSPSPGPCYQRLGKPFAGASLSLGQAFRWGKPFAGESGLFQSSDSAAAGSVSEFALLPAPRSSLLARRPCQGFDGISSALPNGCSNDPAWQAKLEPRGRT
ncbi:MAG: hypothetical protein CFK52_09385 [Chloracidobacterium sp. CP2_5A]|nr:MAG: hypothetical protein CFK52_09385 [Chloracidobacterium sp. CP2_5A]